MAQAIYRKWRPQRFGDVVGQEHITRTLQRAIASGRIGHAYLFCGPRGTGKTTTARLLAKAVNCLHPDVHQRPDDSCPVCKAISEGRFLDLIEIDAASNTGVDDIRDLREKINFSPSEGRYKVYIIDEVHMLSTAAFNALLKTLEEPPPHAIFILATTEEHKVLATIKSRCQQFNFRLLSSAEISTRLLWLAEQESLQIEPEALRMIAREGAGSLRDAESLLDQLVTGPGELITLERVQQVLGTASLDLLAQLVEAWLAGDGARGLETIHEGLNSGADARQFCRQMVVYLRQMVMVKSAGEHVQIDLSAEQRIRLGDQAKRAPYKPLLDLLKRFNEAASSASNNWQPQLPLELAFLEGIAEPVGEAGPVVETTPQPAVTKKSAEPPPTKPQVAPSESAPATPVSPPVSTPPLAKKEEVGKEEAKKMEGGTMSVTFKQIQAQWGEVGAFVRQRDRNLKAVLDNSRPLYWDGATLVIGWEYGMIRDKFVNHRQGLEILREALMQLWQIRPEIRPILTSEFIPPPAQITREQIEAVAHELGGTVYAENKDK